MATPSSAASASSVNPAVATEKSISIPTLFSSSSQAAPVKLDRSNYMYWESVVLPLIEGNRLVSHIDGSGYPTPRRNADDTENPAYEEWHYINRLLVGYLQMLAHNSCSARLLASCGLLPEISLVPLFGAPPDPQEWHEDGGLSC